MSLAPYVRIVARGKGRARALSQVEAHEAMTTILTDDVAPEAVGALLMVLRLRGETDTEIAGFTSALRASMPLKEKADLDWPCYAAGRTRGAPLFLLSAKLVSLAGYRVSIHGWNSHQNLGADPRQALEELGLIGEGLRYDRLEDFNPRAFDLLRLRDSFGLRSCINTVLRMSNPTQALASVQGVFHPSYRGLQSRAAALLGDRNLTVIKGGGGEFEANPLKDTKVFGLKDGVELDETMQAREDVLAQVARDEKAVEIADLWHGKTADAVAEAAVIKTAALALWTVNSDPTFAAAFARATGLWQGRHFDKRASA